MDDLDNKDENVEQLQETIQEEVVETTEEVEEVKEEVSEEEDKQSFISKMKDKLFGSKKEEEEEKTEEKSTVEEDIDTDFSEAALKAGWTEQDIIQFAGKYDNKQLKSLIPFLAAKEEEEKEELEEKKVEDKEVKEDNDLKTIEDKVRKSVEAIYQEKLAEIEKKLNTYEQEKSVKEAQRFQTTADGFFDRAAKDFPVFGKTEELPKFPAGTTNAGQVVPAGEAFEARNKVWQVAKAFYQMGSDWETSLQEALDWYKGKSMEKDIHSKVLKDLKRQEKRLSPKRSTHTETKKYADAGEEKLATIANIARRAGIDT